ncbi:MAG: P-loop NTPase [Spirochaetota bacterium]
MQQNDEKLYENMKDVRHKIVVLSGKGGVGKSTVAVNLAASLAARGLKTGILDVDIHSPSVPTLLGLSRERMGGSGENRIVPIEYSPMLKAVSVGFILEKEEDAVIWRGPLKFNVIRQFLTDVEWGELDYLIIDSPPGTGDEVLAACQLLPDPDGAVVVTTPQDVALCDVAKSITFCGKVSLPVIGVVENMSGYVCPHCGLESALFKKGGGIRISETMNVPFLGSIPLSPAVVYGGDSGNPVLQAGDFEEAVVSAFQSVVDRVLEFSNSPV